MPEPTRELCGAHIGGKEDAVCGLPIDHKEPCSPQEDTGVRGSLAERAHDFLGHEGGCSYFDDGGPGDCDCIASEILAALAASALPSGGGEVRCAHCDRQPQEGEAFARHPDGSYLCPESVRALSRPISPPLEGTGPYTKYERQGIVNALDLLLSEYARTGVIDDEGSQETVVNAVGWFEQVAERRHEFHDVLIDGVPYDESEANRV